MNENVNYFRQYKSEKEKIIVIPLNEMFCTGIPPFRTMKSVLMSSGVGKKKVVCQLPQNIISPIKIKKPLASNLNMKKNQTLY